MDIIDNINLYAINENERNFKVTISAKVGGDSFVAFKVNFPDDYHLILTIPKHEILEVGPLMLSSRLRNAILDKWIDRIKR